MFTWKIFPTITEKHTLFSFELKEKVLENNENSENSGRIEMQNCVEPCFRQSKTSG